jgi:prepilin-type N-terminal cleavage/methylation domain-containing protein/prepilin-type processing-associated H-X9-DG protein
MLMKRKGFTLVELLVVIAIIALLMGILLPSLARVKVIANRMKCGSHLADIGKSMMMYGEENRQTYPIGGIRGSIWTQLNTATPGILQWDASTRELAFANSGKNATITSCLFLLIKYGNMVSKQFTCPDDADAKEFTLGDEYKSMGVTDTTKMIKELSDAWDFGGNPGICCSYSYHIPFPDAVTLQSYARDPTSSPGSPLCADRNPYLDKNATDYIKDPRIPNPYLGTTDGEYHDDKLKGNCASHGRKAQNVLFNDGHVAAESYPNCGISNDNIWKVWPSYTTAPTETQIEVGAGASPPPTSAGNENLQYIPTPGSASPKSKDDACLVNERNDNKQ